jgi:hypothetical protein
MNSRTTQENSNQMNSGSTDSDEISLKDLILKLHELLIYLLYHWKIICLIFIIGSLLGLGYAFIKKPIYKAEFSFVLEDEQSGGNLGGAMGLVSQFGIGSSGGAKGLFGGDNLLELMKSRSIVQRALLNPITVNGKSQSLADYYILFRGMRNGWESSPQLNKLSYTVNADVTQFSRVQDSILMALHKDIIKNCLNVAKLDNNLSVLKLEVKSENEIFAKSFIEALVNEVSRFYIEIKTKKATDNVSILQYQTDSVRNQLNKSISGVAQSNDDIPNLNVARQVLRSSSQQRQIDVQANTAILTELIKNLHLSKMALLKETPLIREIDRPVLPLPVEKFGKLRGAILGGFIAGFLSIFVLIIKRVFKGLTD